MKTTETLISLKQFINPFLLTLAKKSGASKKCQWLFVFSSRLLLRSVAFGLSWTQPLSTSPQSWRRKSWSPRAATFESQTGMTRPRPRGLNKFDESWNKKTEFLIKKIKFLNSILGLWTTHPFFLKLKKLFTPKLTPYP